MRMQLCNFCVKSGILCQKCQEKIRTGTVNETYIKIAKLLIKFEDKYPSIQKIFLNNVYNVDNIIAIAVGSGDSSRLLASRGQILRELSRSIGKRIRVFEGSGDVRKFLEELFMPTKILAINTIWLPDGSTETRVVLPERPRRLSMSREVLKELAEKIRGMTLRITFEDQEERYYS
jgi:transcription antitermination factor NusA-like protein